MKRTGIVILLLGLAGGAGGCGIFGGPPKMERFELAVHVEIPSGGDAPETAVDLIGVQDGDELDTYKAQSLTAWFAGDSAQRQAAIKAGLVYMMKIGPGTSNPQSLLKNDAIWEKWDQHKAMNLVIFANMLPTPDKHALPLANNRWDNPCKVTVNVLKGAIQVDPPPKAKAPLMRHANTRTESENIMIKPIAIVALLMGLAGRGAGGCGMFGWGTPKMERFEVSVYVDLPTGGDAPEIAVDLIGVQNGDELDTYKAQSLTDWFTGNNPQRDAATKAGLVYKMKIGPGTTNPQALLKSDGIWEKWDQHKAMNLVIFANMLPTPEKLALPLADNRWDKPERVTVKVLKGAIQVEPPPKAGEQK